MIKANHSQHGKVAKGHAMKFRTLSGTFTSMKATNVKFSLNEFSESRQIRWKFHVLPEDSKLPYDTIIGRDLMRKLKMDVLYSNNVPMHEVKSTGKWHDFNALVEDQAESESVKDSMSRLTRILDANYDTPDLEAEVVKMTHLPAIQRTLLLALLKKNEDLFDGQLDDWAGDPVEIPLKEGAIPYHARAFPIPHIHESP